MRTSISCPYDAPANSATATAMTSCAFLILVSSNPPEAPPRCGCNVHRGGRRILCDPQNVFGAMPGHRTVPAASNRKESRMDRKLIQYRVKPEKMAENEQLIREVFAELRARQVA